MSKHDDGNYGPSMSDTRLQDMERLARAVDAAVPKGGVFFDALRIRMPEARHGEVLVVLTGTSENGDPVVGFVSGDTMLVALHKTLQKWHEGSVKWREDEFRKPANRGSDSGR